MLKASRLLLVLLLPKSVLAAVKVFIIAGQSNAAGHAHAEHLIELINTTGSPEWAPYWNSQTGNFSVRNDVFVNQNGNQTGNLTISIFGDVPPPGVVYFGPEVGFGWFMGDYYQEPVLLIKSAWGAVALATDFRPPSSGGVVGWQWTAMLNLIHSTLSSLGKYVPGYTRADGYELAGFVWFQGEADAYTPSRLAEYQSNLINFIQDVRYHLSTPDLPFVIGEMGGEGAYPDSDEIQMREIERNVSDIVPNTIFSPTAVLVNYNVTEIFEPDYHYYGRADVYIRIGRSFARNMLVVMGLLSAPTVSPTVFVKTNPPTFAPTLFTSTCSDSSGVFYNAATKKNTRCSWLTNHRRKVKSLCASGMPARNVCPATCGACSVNTQDTIPAPTAAPCADGTGQFKAINVMQTCSWLRQQSQQTQTGLCYPGTAAYDYCQKTCNSCSK
jgi:alpha-galactosidase